MPTLDDDRRALSPRECEVLALAGFPNRYIAARLGISVQTVKNHFYHISQALGIVGRTSRTGSLIYALQHGYIAQEDLICPKFAPVSEGF